MLPLQSGCDKIATAIITTWQTLHLCFNNGVP